MDQQYIRDQYHQAMLEYKAAINEDAQWEARRTMARLETLAIEMFGEGFQKELREKEKIEPEAAQEAGTRGAPRRYRQGTDGQMHRSWNGKLPEEFSEMDALAFLADTDLRLNGTISQDTLSALDQAGYLYKDGLVQAKELQPEQPSGIAGFIEEYVGKIEKLVEDSKNFPVEDSSIFPFEISKGSHAAVRYAYISKSSTYKDMQAVESGVELNVTAAIYRDGTLNEYDQGIEERKFVVKGTDAINGFLEKLGQSVADSVKAHPDIQPVVTVNFSEYDSFNPLVKEHMRLTLDRANSLFELINIVAGDAGAKGHKSSYQTSADIMYVQDGQIRHFDLRQEFGKSGSIIKHMEGYMDDQIKYWERHRTLPDGESRLKEWETAKRELIPYFERHISLSSAGRDLAYLGKAAPVMQDHIFEMRAFLNTGKIVPVPGRDQPEQEDDFSRQIDDMLAGKADRYNDVKVCTTPDLLVQAGCTQLPMFITQPHIRDIIHPKGKNPHWHGLTVQQLKKVPGMISDPVMIFDSANRKDSVVVALGETDNEKLPIIISVRPHGKGKYELAEVESNFITSIYGKDNFLNFIETVIKEDRMVYCNKQKSQELFSVLGLQLPQGFNNLDFDKIIHVSRNIVKEGIVPGAAYKGTGMEPNPDGKAAPAEPQKEEIAGDGRVYLSLPSVSKEKFTALLQELKQNDAKFDRERKQWYTDKESAESGVFNAYLWTYLTLPPMKREEYFTVIDRMKQDGARFDRKQKKWYIDGNCDRDKFLAYLESGSQEQASVTVPQPEAAQTTETPVTYYPINEAAAKRAKEAISHSDYRPGSATAEYRRYVDEAAEIAARQKKSVDPSFHGKIDGLLDAYARKLAANMNKGYEITARVPSILITGGGNFPVQKKEKQNAAAEKNMQEFSEIQGLLEKIRSTGTGGISADDPQAIQKLEAKLEKLQSAQDTMKAVNAYYRRNQTLDGCPHLLPGQLEKLKGAMSISGDSQTNRQPFASYQFSNNNAEIHRIKDRIATLTRRKEISFVGWEFDGGHVEANAADNRLQVFFDEKPAQEVRESLKGNGFRYAPSVGAWQRQLTGNAIYAADRIKYIQPLTGERPTELQKDPVSGKRSSVLGQLEEAKGAASGHGAHDQARDEIHRQKEKLKETGYGRE